MKNTKINESEYPNENNTKTLCRNLLSCGDDDIRFLLGEFESFDVDIFDAIQYAKELSGALDFNSVVEAVYMLAIQSVNPDAIVGEDYEIHTNYSDSSLSIRTEDDWVEVTDIDELREKLQVTEYEEDPDDEPLEESVSMDQFYTNMLK